jgi:O-antigen ligase
MIIRTYGAGVGPANFASTATAIDMPYRVITPNPHNFFIEIGAQYGILVLAMFIGVFSCIVKPGVVLVLRKRFSAPDSAKVLFLGAIAYPIACLANSSFIAQPSNWLFIGTLLALNFQLIRNQKGLA